MKHIFISFFFCILFMLPLIGCSFDVKKPNNHTQSNLAELNETEYNEDLADGWQDAYADYLRRYPASADNEIYEFSLRDIDNNGVPELVIIQQDDTATNAILSVYSYDSSVYKIGDYTNPKESFVEGLRISDNPDFPGLFESWSGGGVEYCGYLTISEGKLEHEDLWYIDRFQESLQPIKISDDEALINESIDAYKSYNYSKNVLEMYLINDDNINGVINTFF